MLVAYTDASCCTNASAGAVLLMSDDELIDYSLTRFYGVEYSSRAELLALLVAIRMVSKHFDTPQDVLVYCDYITVVERGNLCLSTRKVDKTWAFYRDWLQLLDAVGEHNVRLEHIKAHQTKLSPNSVCDMLSHRLAKGD